VLAQREQAEDPRVANLALVRSMEIHDRLTKVALGGEGQAGIAQAVCELTGRPAAIEVRFGNLLAWTGSRLGHIPHPARPNLGLTPASVPAARRP
jgi:hypothetical protein